MNNVSEPGMELIAERILLWQDFTYPVGYRASLTMLVFEDGTRSLEFNVGGYVVRRPYYVLQSDEE
jgi:hypothetical protein